MKSKCVAHTYYTLTILTLPFKSKCVTHTYYKLKILTPVAEVFKAMELLAMSVILPSIVSTSVVFSNSGISLEGDGTPDIAEVQDDPRFIGPEVGSKDNALSVV